MEVDEPLLPSFVDPPYQQKVRSIVLPLMTPAKIDPLEPQMHRVCADLIGHFKDRGHCDIVQEFARQYPIRIFSELFGLPREHQEEFRRLAETFLHDQANQSSAWNSIREIVREQLAKKRVHPQDDLLSGIVNGKIDGVPVDEKVAVNLASTVFLGGLDTLPSNIGWTFRHLASRPDLRRRIIEDPSIVPQAVEEFLRIYTVTARSGRRATRDIDFHGIPIRAGDHVVPLLSLANTDSAEFDDPLSPNFDRKVNRHIAFAAGAHRCLGSHLARHELQVALIEWHNAIPDYRVDPNAELLYHAGSVFAIDNLPLVWDV